MQELAISLLGRYAHKLPSLLEWSDRDVDYKALIATNWEPLIRALSNWEAKGNHDRAASSRGAIFHY